jgi:hypothetical protein
VCRGSSLAGARGRRRSLGWDQSLIELEQDLSFLPAGVVGQVTVYTGRSHVTDLVRQIILPMNSWLNYIPFEIQRH